MEKKLTNVQVNRILYESHERLLPSPLSVPLANLEDLTGAYKGHIEGYRCPRCGKNEGYLYFNKIGCMYFCGDSECLQIDSEASKSKRVTVKYGSPKDAAILFGLGSRYLNACLTKCDSNPHVSMSISEWIKKPKNMLILEGATNRGKTYFCMALANYLLDQQQNVKYILYRRLFEEIQKAIQKNDNQYSIVEKLSEAEVLIIDDVGASVNTPWQQEMFLDLIDRRYSNQKVTIITTNFNEAECLQHLGERTSRRMYSKENLVITLGPEYDR